MGLSSQETLHNCNDCERLLQGSANIIILSLTKASSRGVPSIPGGSGLKGFASLNFIEVLSGKETTCQRNRLWQKRSLRRWLIRPFRIYGIAAWIQARCLPLWRNALEAPMPADFAKIQPTLKWDTRLRGYSLPGEEEKMPTPHQSESRNTLDIELIRCARQPGNLRITRHACALRYLRSMKTEPAVPKNEFEMMRKTGLDICRSCTKGRLYAEDLSSQAF